MRLAHELHDGPMQELATIGFELARARRRLGEVPVADELETIRQRLQEVNLELRNFATNIDAGGNFPAIALDPNFKLYYGEAVMNGFSVAERMNGRNGGQLQWVSGQAGFFSATNVAYPDGTIHRLNSALVASCSLDSNNNGSANCIDPAPVWVASQYRLSAALTNGPVPAIVLTWRTVGSATNSIYTTTNLAEPSWQLLTNFVSEPAIGPPLTKRFGAALGAGPRFYRVQVDVP